MIRGGKCDYDSDRSCIDTQPSEQRDTLQSIDRCQVTGAAAAVCFQAEPRSAGCQRRRKRDGEEERRQERWGEERRQVRRQVGVDKEDNKGKEKKGYLWYS